MLKGALVGLLLAILAILFTKIATKSRKNDLKKFWVCPTCSQKNFTNKDECSHCGTKKPVE